MEKSSKDTVLTHAFVDIVSSMSIPDDAVSKILGAEPEFMAKLRSRQTLIETRKGPGRNAVQLIQAMDHLYRLVGQQETEAVRWLNQQNQHFSNKSPIETMSCDGGLEKVCRYLKESSSSH